MSDTHNQDGRRGGRGQQPHQHPIDPAVDPTMTAAVAPSQQAVEDAKRQKAEADERRAEQISKAEEKAKERREKSHEAAMKQEDEAFKRAEETNEKARETTENRRKEEARLATMSPEQRVEEEERIADMTPDERAKYFLESGRTIPLEQPGGGQFAGGVRPTPLAGTSMYPVLLQHQPPTEFVLSEANGQRSRGNAYLADPVMVYAASLLKQTAPETQLMPPTYVLATAGADADAIALYGGTSVPVDGLRISVIVRDAEVNKHCITWSPLAGAEIDAAIAQLATKGIICR